MKTLLLFSGGLNSTVLLSLLKHNKEEVQCVNFSYGGNHNRRELISVRAICANFLTPLIVLDLEFIKRYFRSALLEDAGAIPSDYTRERKKQPTEISFLNGIMLSIVAGLADSWNADTVSIAIDNRNLYPDCNDAFLDPFRNAMFAGTQNGIGLFIPFFKMDKGEIIRLGHDKNAPLFVTYSCLRGGDIHCGTCCSCKERKEAFNQAGLTDCTQYLE
jgi:7-cyano-7-deazaguanine synthase